MVKFLLLFTILISSNFSWAGTACYKPDKLFKINVCSKNCGSRSKAETIRLQWKGTSKTIWTYEGNDMIDQVLNLIKINNSLPSSKLYCRDFKGNFYLK